jgi:glutamate/tyrosine decarboxylase-like PLP-dependent enzyme
VVNPHKWLYVPAEAACILVREPRALRQTFQLLADYLREEHDEGAEGPIDFKITAPSFTGISGR